MAAQKKDSLNYQGLAKEAIVGLKERTGSSSQAIAKYLENSTEHKGKLPENFRLDCFISCELVHCLTRPTADIVMSGSQEAAASPSQTFGEGRQAGKGEGQLQVRG